METADDPTLRQKQVTAIVSGTGGQERTTTEHKERGIRENESKVREDKIKEYGREQIRQRKTTVRDRKLRK
jgi:hypothetical protein